MYQTSTNITPKCRQETCYNYMENSVFLLQIVLRFCAIVSLVLHLPHKFLRKCYHKATGFASSGKKETQRHAFPTSERGIMTRIF